MDNIDEWIEKLRGCGKLIVVEGWKDKKALATFGINSEPLDRRAIFVVAEDIAARAKDVVILTDLDSEGKKLYSMLQENLARNGVRIDRVFREWLFRETDLRQIEGLPRYYERTGEVSNSRERRS